MTVVMRGVKRVVRSIGSRLRQGVGADVPAGVETGAGWYDELFAGSSAYQRPYAESFYYFLWSVIADRLRVAGIKRVLEIGCGTGQLAGLMIDLGLEEYVGLDFSPRAIAIARRNTPRGRFVVGDARDPEVYAGTRYDAIVCTEVLEHINDDLKVVSRFGTGKRCLCSVPSFPHESHVRLFKDADEVASRYGPFFNGLDVVEFKSPRYAPDRFFLFDGVRNDREAPVAS